MKKALLLLLILAVFFGSCTTQRIAVLKPNVPEQYLDKDGFVTQKSDSLDVTFGYLFSTQDYLVFEVAVKNNSSDSVRVNPQNFSFQPMLTSDSTQISMPIYAHSFTQITSQLNARVREKHIKSTIIVLAVVAAAVAVEASANKHTPHRYRDYSFAIRTGVDLSFNYFDAVAFSQISKKEARKGLEGSLMFPLTIGPAEPHIGTVYFPRFDNAKELLFNFKTNEQDFKTLFKQTLVNKTAY